MPGRQVFTNNDYILQMLDFSMKFAILIFKSTNSRPNSYPRHRFSSAQYVCIYPNTMPCARFLDHTDIAQCIERHSLHTMFFLQTRK